MPVITVRPEQTMHAIHSTDPDFKEVVEGWFSQSGESLEDFYGVVDAQEQKPWVVRTTDGATIGIVHPANFAANFSDVAATDVLMEIWEERATHPIRGYTAAHDDAQPTRNIIGQTIVHLNVAGDFHGTGNPTDAEKRRELVQAGSLIVAAIDKIDRAQNVRTFAVDAPPEG